MVEVYERGIWPSAENTYLYERFLRCACPEAGDEFYPLFEFGADERELARAFLCLALYFIWGVRIRFSDGTLVQVDHDQFATVFAATQEWLDTWVQVVQS